MSILDACQATTGGDFKRTKKKRKILFSGKLSFIE
jgi:hypothetical protein